MWAPLIIWGWKNSIPRELDVHPTEIRSWSEFQDAWACFENQEDARNPNRLNDNCFRVNYRVPKAVRHGNSLHRISPKLSIDSSPSRLESQTSVRWPTAKIFGSSPIRLDSQASVCRPTLKLFGLSPSRLESPASVRRPLLKLFGSSPSRLSFGRRRNCWITPQPSVPWPSQPLTTHVLDVWHPPVTETKMSPIVCTAQN